MSYLEACLTCRLVSELDRQWSDAVVWAPGRRAAGAPDAVVEVWRPSDTFGTMLRAREAAGAPVFIEAYLTDRSTACVRWYAMHDGSWTLRAAEGDQPLVIDGPRPFSVVPNALLRPQ